MSNTSINHADGDIRGAFGTIRADDSSARHGWRRHGQAMLAIIGPGLITMVGDNDAGGFSIYAQAGQNYGTALLWTLLLLVPVLYVNQEMVLRLGAVSGVGHARLILARFGKFWGAFSIIDLFALNALTLLTEFIGIAMALQVLGVPKIAGVACAAALIMLAVASGDLRRFERFALLLVFLSLLLVPLFVLIHPPLGQVARDLTLPGWPQSGHSAEVLLLVIGIVGTTIAPWQLFFQQSYVVDKRITPAFLGYARADLWLGIALVCGGAVAIMAITAGAFADSAAIGHFVDCSGVANAIGARQGRLGEVLFAVTLLDASLIGACAVSLSTAYALTDMLQLRHSLYRKPAEARTFYGVHFLLVGAAALLVLLPGTPLGLLTNTVQTLAGVLLPSATVFLLLLCNDKAVLGPWVNTRGANLFAGLIIMALLLLSLILTASVLWPDLSDRAIRALLGYGSALGLAAVLAAYVLHLRKEVRDGFRIVPRTRLNRRALCAWRMPPLEQLAAPVLSTSSQMWMGVLRAYLLLAAVLVVAKVAELALA